MCRFEASLLHFFTGYVSRIFVPICRRSPRPFCYSYVSFKVAVALPACPGRPLLILMTVNSGKSPDVSHRLRRYTADVAFPKPTSQFILNIQVMYSFTISTVIITRFTSCVRFIFTSHGLGRFSICPSVRLLGSLSQRLLTSLPESLLCQFAKATAALFRTSLVDTSSEASI